MGRFRDSFALAGWLFADIMVALAVLFFAAEPRHLDVAPPALSSFSPGSGAPGTRVTLVGTNLRQVDLVRFGNTRAQPASPPTDTMLEVDVPAGGCSARHDGIARPNRRGGSHDRDPWCGSKYPPIPGSSR